MPDISILQTAVKSFAFNARPTSLNPDTPCTVEDINKLIREISKVLNVFIDELGE